jgi:integrase
MRLGKVRKSDVDAWLAGLKRKGLAPSTRRTAYVVLSAVFADAVADDRLARNVVLLAERPRVPRQEAAYLSVDQVRQLLEGADSSRYRPLFEILVRTGLRRGEGLALRWVDVDEKQCRLHVRGTLSRVDGELVVTAPKGGRPRTLRLSPAVAGILAARRAEQRREKLRAGSKWVSTGYVYTTELGEPCDPRNALRALKAAAEKAGLEGIGVHTLRHSAAAAMIEGGDHLKVISEQLGHSSTAITGDVYGHVSPGLAEDAADRLGDVFG